MNIHNPCHLKLTGKGSSKTSQWIKGSGNVILNEYFVISFLLWLFTVSCNIKPFLPLSLPNAHRTKYVFFIENIVAFYHLVTQSRANAQRWKNYIWLLPPSIPSTFVSFLNTYASYTYQWLWLIVLTKKSNTNKGKNKSCWGDPGDLNTSIGKSMSICPCMFWCVSIMLKHYL